MDKTVEIFAATRTFSPSGKARLEPLRGPPPNATPGSTSARPPPDQKLACGAVRREFEAKGLAVPDLDSPELAGKAIVLYLCNAADPKVCNQTVR